MDNFAAFDRQFGFTQVPSQQDQPKVQYHQNHHIKARFQGNHLDLSNQSPPQRVKQKEAKTKAPPKENLVFKLLKCLQGSTQYRVMMMQRANMYGVNTVSQIDKISRILFPLSFIFLNIIYWIAYTK